MIKFTLVGDDLNIVREVLVDAVISQVNEMKERSYEQDDMDERTLQTMKYMEVVRVLSALYMKSINEMEVVDG